MLFNLDLSSNNPFFMKRVIVSLERTLHCAEPAGSVRAKNFIVWQQKFSNLAEIAPEKKSKLGHVS